MADLFTNYNCTNCQDGILGIRVHCGKCVNFDLCLQCFAAGAEIGDHYNSHPYQFIDTGSNVLSVFRGTWSAREELRLLDAIEKYGYGNWEDISKHIETKTAEEAKEEYINKYLSGTVGRHTWNPAQRQRPQLKDHTLTLCDNGPLTSKAQESLPLLDVLPEEASQLSYMPNRDSFEREYDPTAETLISSLTLSVDDNETDYLLKLAHVDMYTRRLRERARRKRVVRDYQLVANYFRGKSSTQNNNQRVAKDQREFRDRFRVFSQFYSSQEYDRLLASLERERELRIRLSELHRYRWNGLTKIDDCLHFEQHAAISNRNTGPFGHGKTETNKPGNQVDTFSPYQPRIKMEEIDVKRESSSSIEPNSMRLIGDRTYSDGLSPSKNYSDNYRGLSGQPMIVMSPTSTSTQLTAVNKYQPTSNNNLLQSTLIQNANGNIKLGEDEKKHILQQRLARKQLLQQQQHQFQVTQQQSPELMSTSTPTTNDLISITLKNQLTLKHQQIPQTEENLLTNNEIKLCSKLNILPTEYLSIKTVLLYNNNNNSSSSNNNHNDVANGGVNNHNVNGSSNNNSYNTSVISKYLYKAGWRH
ncbi:TADA2B family protein [Megaselia abdita]